MPKTIHDIDDVLPEQEEKAPGTFDIFAKFGVALNDLTEEIKKSNKLEQDRLARVPNYVPISLSSIPGAAVTDVKDFGGPQPGRIWTVRLLSAVAVPLAANATIITWYVGQIMPGTAAGELPATMARWQFASVPSFEDFTSDIIKLNAGERLIAGLTGVPALTNIVLTAIILDMPGGRLPR